MHKGTHAFCYFWVESNFGRIARVIQKHARKKLS